MLIELLTSNRKLLIERCREKVAKRFPPGAIPAIVDHGVPLFLNQLAATLRNERLTRARPSSLAEPALMSSDIGRAAALHGVELLRLGYRIDQVVHHYGDVCQGLEDLAGEDHVQITLDPLRCLNRSLV